MASWVYAYTETYQIVYFKMQFLYVIYTSIKLVKHFFFKISFICLLAEPSLATLGLSLVVASIGYSPVAVLGLLTEAASLVAEHGLPKMFAARFFLLSSHITKGEIKEGEFGVERNSKVSCWKLTHLIFGNFTNMNINFTNR